MSNDTLLQLLDELKDVVKNGGIIKVNGNGGISAYSISDSNNDNQAENSLQNILDELTKSGKASDKQCKEIKDKVKDNEYKPDSYNADYDPTDEDEDGKDGDYFDEYDPESYESNGYDPEGVTETDIDELINKLVDERKELKAKISRLGNALADLDTITKVGSEQYHLMNMQYNSMVAYCNILSERINFLKYDNGID